MAHEITYYGEAPDMTTYAVLRRRTTGYIWDDDAGAMAANPTRANSALSLTETNESVYEADMPADLPNGKYDVLVFLQAAPLGSPDDDDVILETLEISKSGVIPVKY